MKSLGLVLGMALIAAVIGFGCSDDDENGGTNPTTNTVPAELVGTWWFTSGTMDGSAITSFADISFTDTSHAGAVGFAANDTWTQKETYNGVVVFTRSGTVKVHGDTLKITILIDNGNPASPDDTSSSYWNVSGDVLTLANSVPIMTDTIDYELLYTRE